MRYKTLYKVAFLTGFQINLKLFCVASIAVIFVISGDVSKNIIFDSFDALKNSEI